MQTAVEWLVDRIAEKSVMEKDRYYIQYKSVTIDITHIIEQAKEMEKQQIMNAYEDGDINGYKSGVVRNSSLSDISPEQYYYQTYEIND